MPLPLILGAAAAYSAKKTYDNYRDKSTADSIMEAAKANYESAKKNFDNSREKTLKKLNHLRLFQLKIEKDCREFYILAQELLKNEKIPQINFESFFPKDCFAQIEFDVSKPDYFVTMAIGAISGIGGLFAWNSYNSKVKNYLNNAQEIEKEVQEVIEKMLAGHKYFLEIQSYINKILTHLRKIYEVFHKYFDVLKYANALLVANKKEIIEKEKDEMLFSIGNGAKLIKILAAIISTPLFKIKTDSRGNTLYNKENIPLMAVDKHGLKVLNREGIDKVLGTARF